MQYYCLIDALIFHIVSINAIWVSRNVASLSYLVRWRFRGKRTVPKDNWHCCDYKISREQYILFDILLSELKEHDNISIALNHYIRLNTLGLRAENRSIT